jgi:hypothetical protein
MTPLTDGYRPELDVSPEINPQRANCYQGVTRILRWLVELGRVVILLEVSLLSHILANLRQGLLARALHIFTCLKTRKRSMLVFDGTKLSLILEDSVHVPDQNIIQMQKN